MPAIIKPSRIATALAVEPADGGGMLTISAYLLFDFADNRTFYTDQALWPMVTEQLPKGAVFDKAQLKPVGEWLVAGSAMAPDQPVQGMRVTVRVGDRVKRLAVFGDRYWRLTERGLVMTEATPFLNMPIDDTHAFGGPDFKANPTGRGHGARKFLEGGHDAPLPNVEFAEQLIRSPDDQAMPATLGPIPPDSPLRFRYVGTYDKAWMRTRAPLKPLDFNPLFHCDAPMDQRLEAHLRGDEMFSVSGMTRGTDSANGRLPNVRLRAFVERPADGSFTETTMACDTLTLFPNITKATLAFRGLAKSLDAMGDDIGTVMLALEHAEDAPRPADYYLHIFRLRKDPTQGHLHALSDFQLMPERDPAIRAARRQAKLRTALEERIRFLDNQNWAARKTVQDQGLSPDIVPPVDYEAGDYIPLVAKPTDEEIALGEVDLAELMEDVKALEQAINGRKDLEMARAELHRRELVESVPAGLLPGVALRPIVDDAHMARFQDVRLEDDISAAFASLRDRTKPGAAGVFAAAPEEPLPSEFAALPAQIDAIFSGLDSIRAIDVDKQYRDAVGRALDLPEASPLYDVRQSLSGLEVGGAAGFSGMSPKPDEEGFVDLFANFGAVQVRSTTDGGRPANLFPGQEPGGPDVAAAEAAMRQAGEVIGERFPHLVDANAADDPIAALRNRMAGFAPPNSLAEGATIASVLADRKADAETRIESAEEDLKQGMREARRMSPAPLFPMEPMSPEAARRFGQFIKGRVQEGHDFKGADLSGADLRGADFRNLDLAGTFFERTDLTQANFSGANLEGAVFTGAILDGADLTGTRLRGVNLNKASLKVAQLDKAALLDAVLIETDLSGISLRDGELASTNLIDCLLDDADLSGTRVADVQWLRGHADRVLVENATVARVVVMALSMTGVSFSGSELERIGFVDIEAAGADFAGATMRSVAFLGKCNLRGGRFGSLRAVESSWNSANLDETCFLRAECRSSLFNDCELNFADMRLASFRDCRFDKSRMKESDLFAANLYAASLSSVDFRLASLRGANLYAANLQGTKFASADLTGANLVKTLMEAPHG